MPKKLPMIQRVANYYETTPEEYRLEFISSKWFIDQEEIPSVKQYVIRRNANEISQYYDIANSKFACDSVNEIEDWIENYKEYYLTFNESQRWWYEPKYAKAGRRLAITESNLSDLPFALNKKQLTIIGVMLYKPKEKVMFITTGISNSGKSTFGNIVQQLFENDVASCSLDDLSNEFNVAEAIHHRLIYSDELSSSDLNSAVIKQLCAKEKINCNPKNQRPYTVQSQSALLFNCNKPPRIDLEDTGLLTRIIYYCCDTAITNPNPLLKDKEFTEEELTNIAAHAYLTLRENWRDDFEKETFKTLISNNSVYIYLQSMKAKKIKPVYYDMTYTYNETYKGYCSEKGLKPFSEPNYDKIKEYIEETESHILVKELW